MEEKQRSKKVFIGAVILAVLMAGIVMVFSLCTIKEISVEGNEHYTEEEIKELVMTHRYDYNTFYFYWRVKNDKIKDIPFIDDIEVSILSRSKVKIKVYEKDIIGYVRHLGYNLYFDKEGVVVESSQEEIEGVPRIKGISFDNVKLYEPLPVEKEDVFKKILNLTKLLAKYEIPPDSINFSKELSVTLSFEDANVLLGKDIENDEKIVKLKQLLPGLEGMKGTLHLENYDEDMKNITFKKEE
ncbi:MAG: FtsQ-type POTRA domain-containing protein [Lachnospiraceae bacterium]|nr:FtsQ-type POTRA domain-containing protein [Lachnospiraceae bacterium]